MFRANSSPKTTDDCEPSKSAKMAFVPQPVDSATIELGTREFCAFGVQNQISCMPVDDVSSASDRTATLSDPEQAEDNLFKAFHEFLSHHDILPTVPPGLQLDTDEPQVLDCGYGSGIWIEELLDMDVYTDSVVSEKPRKPDVASTDRNL